MRIGLMRSLRTLKRVPRLRSRPLRLISSRRNGTENRNEKYDEYRHPLITRYASPQMRAIWSERNKFTLWRRLWVALAEAQMELGVSGITSEKIQALNEYVDDIDFEYAEKEEKRLRHDVMAHIHTYAHQVPSAAGILHLGATSCFVQDNGDLCQIRQSLQITMSKLAKVIRALRNVAVEYKDMPALGYTHLQPAQLTTVGKRMSLWLQDFYMDFVELSAMYESLPFRGIKGTTGTQASFLHVFENDHEKVVKLEKRVAAIMGFPESIPLSGQTYTRKVDHQVLSRVSGIGTSAQKMCTDLRLLASFKEAEEPFEVDQVGSSAMAYKRNPMRSERVCSLSRYLCGMPFLAGETHGVQWMERSLDDSAIRRMILPESFLCVDAILDICLNILEGIVIWPRVIESRVNEEIPFMASENILMECVKKGGNRQELHERIRVHSMESAKRVKEEGKENDLMERIRGDKMFQDVHGSLNALTDAKLFIGRAPEQVEGYVRDVIDPFLKDHAVLIDLAETGQLNV